MADIGPLRMKVLENKIWMEKTKIVRQSNSENKGHFPLGGIFRAERHFLLFDDQLAESGRQKTKKISFRLVENGLKRGRKNAYI